MSKKRNSDESAMDVAQQLQSKRTNTGTKENYRSKINVMTRWMHANYKDAISDCGNLIIPAQKESILQFFGHLCRNATMLDAATRSEITETPLSVSCVKGYRSAFVDLHKQKHINLDESLDAELKSLLDGYEKVVNDLKKQGKMKINEGKRHLKSNGYEMLAMKLMQKVPRGKGAGESWSMVSFGWTFFVMMWNLMSRADSVDTIMLQHIEWSEDALVIEEQGHKGDQTGENKYGKHIYANPIEPMKCPILSLAVLIFCCPTRSKHGKQQLFAGTNSKERFGHLLRQLLQSLDESELQVLGCPPDDIGSHSLRKGSSTYALGQVNGPTPVSVFLRMGQSLGKLKDRYIHASEGADQLCGRMVAGLPFNDVNFSILPPHFTASIQHQLTEAFWKKVVGGYEYYPRGFKSCFPFLLASLVYHESFLREHLHASHPIFRSRAFTHNTLLDEMRNNTLLGTGSCEHTHLKATGIPPHLAIASQVRKVYEETEKLRQELRTMKTHLAHELPDKVASRVADEIRDNFVVDGVAPLSIRDIDARMDSLRDSIVSEFARFTQRTQTAGMQPASVAPTWQTFSWGDGLLGHCVPKGWRFPDRISTKALWDLWWFGEKNTGIRPYRLINRKFDIDASQRMQHSRAKCVMEFCTEVMHTLQLLPHHGSVSDIQIDQSDAIFDQLYSHVIGKLYGDTGTRRPEEVCYGRIYNLLCAMRKKQKDRQA